MSTSTTLPSRRSGHSPLRGRPLDDNGAIEFGPTGGIKLPDPTSNLQIDKAFTYHAPKGDQSERYTQLRDKAKEFALLIDEQCPNSREKSLALTNLEQSVMWANAAIARNE